MTPLGVSEPMQRDLELDLQTGLCLASSCHWHEIGSVISPRTAYRLTRGNSCEAPSFTKTTLFKAACIAPGPRSSVTHVLQEHTALLLKKQAAPHCYRILTLHLGNFAYD